MLNFIIKRKFNEKSHFLYQEYLRVGTDPVTRGYPHGQGQGYGDLHEGQIESESRKFYLPTFMTRLNPRFDHV